MTGQKTAREVTGESCDETVDALALIVAVTVDPEALTTPAAPARPRPSESPATASNSPSTNASMQLHMLVGAQAGVVTGVPVEMFGVPIFWELRLDRTSVLSPSFLIGFRRAWSNRVPAPPGSMSFALTEGFFVGCPLAGRLGWLGFRPCVRVAAGGQYAEAVDIDGATKEDLPWFSAGVLGRLTFSPWEWLELEVDFGATKPAYLRSFGITRAGPPQQSVSPVLFEGSAGASVQFR